MAGTSLIRDRKHAPERLGRVLVLGLGKSGRAAVDYLLPLVGGRVELLAVAAGARTPASEEFAARACDSGAIAAFDDEAVGILAEQAGGSFDLCVASPGIPGSSVLYASAAAVSAEVVSEVEFAWRESAADSRWAAVTGTNGKTTVVACAAHLLRAAGMRADAVGNIGDPCIAAVAAGGTDVYVAEVSSYQLASTRLFAPDVAVLLNITPDHLHWHGTFEAYRDAKFRLLSNLGQVPGSVAVLDATNDVVRAEVRRLRALPAAERGFAYVPLGTAAGMGGDMRARCGSDNAAFIAADGALTVALGGREHVLARAGELALKGAHNAGNALAAAACALALGADGEAVAEGLRTFAPLEHRIEPCGSAGGALCYNDSKATNVDAALTALAAFPDARPIVLLGGEDKGTDLALLVAAARARARAAVCFGAAGERFAAAFGVPAVCRPPEPADAAAFPGTRSRGDAGGSRTGEDGGAQGAPLEGSFDSGGFAASAQDDNLHGADFGGPAGAPSAVPAGCSAPSVVPSADAIPSVVPSERSESKDPATGARQRGAAIPDADFAVLRANHLEDAFDAALSIAREGDIVLLSPACASFDEFGSFEERGRAFKALVADRAARAEA